MIQVRYAHIASMGGSNFWKVQLKLYNIIKIQTILSSAERDITMSLIKQEKCSKDFHFSYSLIYIALKSKKIVWIFYSYWRTGTFHKLCAEKSGKIMHSVRKIRWIFCSAVSRQHIINKTYMLTRSCGIISKNTGHSIRLQSDGDETRVRVKAIACTRTVLIGSAECSALGG